MSNLIPNPRYGVVIGLYAADAGYDIEIQRAPDQGGSPHPDTSTYAILGPVAGSSETYTDTLPSDGALRHYRIRHVRGGEDPSPWTCWVKARPVLVSLLGPGRADPVLPVVRESAPVVNDQRTITLTIDDPQCRVTEVAFDVGAGYVPVAGSGGVYASPTVPASAHIRARVMGYDAGGRHGVILERDFGEGGRAGPPGPPGPGLTNPRITLRRTQLTGDQGRYEITATDWQGGTSGLQYRYVYHTADTPLPGWPDWSTLPAAGVDHWIPRDGRYDMILAVQVRESADHDRISNAEAAIPPSNLTTFTDVEGAAGDARDQAVGIAGGYTDNATAAAITTAAADASSKASQAQTNAITEVEGRGLGPDSYTGDLGLGDHRISASDAESRAGSQYRADEALAYSYDEMHDRGLRLDGYQGIIGGPGGLHSSALVQQARSPGQNRWGVDAGREESFPGVLDAFYEVAGREISLAAAGIRPGDIVSLTALCRNTINGNVQIALRWIAPGGPVSWSDAHFVTRTPYRIDLAGVEVPAGATHVRPAWRRRSNGNAAGYAGEWMLTPGPVALPFEEPPFRVSRDMMSDIKGPLPPWTRVQDGGSSLVLLRGARELYLPNGTTGHNFGSSYEDVPLAIVQGPMATHASQAGKTIFRYEYLDNLTASGFSTLVCELVEVSDFARHDPAFPSGLLTAVGDSAEILNVTPQASLHRYTATFGVSLSATGPAGIGGIDVSVTVAVDSRTTSGTYLERGTRTYSLSAEGGAHREENFAGEIEYFGATRDARVRIKRIGIERWGAAGGSASAGVSAGRLIYSALGIVGSVPQTQFGHLARVVIMGAS